MNAIKVFGPKGLKCFTVTGWEGSFQIEYNIALYWFLSLTDIVITHAQMIAMVSSNTLWRLRSDHQRTLRSLRNKIMWNFMPQCSRGSQYTIHDFFRECAVMERLYQKKQHRIGREAPSFPSLFGFECPLEMSPSARRWGPGWHACKLRHGCPSARFPGEGNGTPGRAR